MVWICEKEGTAKCVQTHAGDDTTRKDKEDKANIETDVGVRNDMKIIGVTENDASSLGNWGRRVQQRLHSTTTLDKLEEEDNMLTAVKIVTLLKIKQPLNSK